MPNPSRFYISPRPMLTPRSLQSRVRVEEHSCTAISYQLSLDEGATWSQLRTVAPSAYGLYPMLHQLLAIVAIVPMHSQDAGELERIEREIHEDIIEHELMLQQRENARLYAGR